MGKYILLDIDGVLTSDAYTRQCKAERIQPNTFGLDWFDPHCINMLQSIIVKTGARIVLSSSWRDLGIDRMKKVWSDNSLPGVLAGTTPEWILTKKEAILEWIDGHPDDKYVIVDDADLRLQNQVRPNPITGLTAADAETVVRMLNTKKDARAESISEYKFDPDNVWFTSDTHFGHENIIKFCQRPFANTVEMDAELIRRWNETVPPEGIVFHLGDFCHGGPAAWNRILKQLNGKKYLILGNHDFKNIKNRSILRFESVTQQMVILVGEQSIILNHNPFLCYGGSYRDVWQLFGHVHSGPFSHTGLDLPRLKMLFPLQYDVGVDNNDFRPVSFEEVKAKIDAQLAEARQAAGLPNKEAADGTRRVVFFDSSVTPSNSAQEDAFSRIRELADDVIKITGEDAHSLKEEIGKRVALLSGNVRYVYIGAVPLEDFRCVCVDKAIGITLGTIDTAIAILK